jgi:hypothetical protein
MYDVDLSYYHYFVLRNQHDNFITCVKVKIVVSQVLVTFGIPAINVVQMEYIHIVFFNFFPLLVRFIELDLSSPVVATTIYIVEKSVLSYEKYQYWIEKSDQW